MGHHSYILGATIVVIGAVIVFNITGKGPQPGTDGLDRTRIEARDAAIAGLNLSLRGLAGESEKWADGAAYSYPKTDYQESAFETRVVIVNSVSGDTAEVLATGTRPAFSTEGEVEDVVYTIQARLVRAQQGDEQQGDGSQVGKPVIISYAEW